MIKIADRLVLMEVTFLRASGQHIIIQKLTTENAKSMEKAQRAKG